MRIIDHGVLTTARQRRNCEWCGAPRSTGLEPAHIFSRGAGRVDIKENVVALCHLCHRLNHAGLRPTRKEMLGLAAKREHTIPDEIERIVKLVIRTVKPIDHQAMTPSELLAYALAERVKP